MLTLVLCGIDTSSSIGTWNCVSIGIGVGVGVGAVISSAEFCVIAVTGVGIDAGMGIGAKECCYS